MVYDTNVLKLYPELIHNTSDLEDNNKIAYMVKSTSCFTEYQDARTPIITDAVWAYGIVNSLYKTNFFVIDIDIPSTLDDSNLTVLHKLTKHIVNQFSFIKEIRLVSSSMTFSSMLNKIEFKKHIYLIFDRNRNIRPLFEYIINSRRAICHGYAESIAEKEYFVIRTSEKMNNRTPFLTVPLLISKSVKEGVTWKNTSFSQQIAHFASSGGVLLNTKNQPTIQSSLMDV